MTFTETNTTDQAVTAEVGALTIQIAETGDICCPSGK